MQRSIICMMVIFGTLSGVYLIPTIYEDYINLERAARTKSSLLSSLGDVSVPQQVDSVDGFARSAVSAVHQKAKELKSNSSVVSFVVFFTTSTQSLPLCLRPM